MRNPRGTRSLRPLAGQTGLRVGDVRMMLRGPFWPEAVKDCDIPPLGMAAGFALQALAGLPYASVARMPLAGALPKGKARSVAVPVHRDEEQIRVTAATAQVIAAWKRVRPAGRSENLIVSLDGESITPEIFRHHMKGVAKTLGFESSLTDLAPRFFKEQFFASSTEISKADHRLAAAEAAVLDLYFARFDARFVAAPPTAEQHRFVLERTDPFPDADKEFLDPQAAIADARAAGTDLPDSFNRCFAIAADALAALPADHPLCLELANTAWENDARRRDAQCAAIYRRHRDGLADILPAGGLGRAILAPMFGLGSERFSRIARTVDAQEGDPFARPPRSKDAPAPRPTPEQAERLARIEELSGRTDETELLRKHGPFVFGLVKAGVIDNERGTELLRVGMGRFVRMKRDFLAGVFDHWLAAPLSRKESLAWQEFVHARAGERRPGQTESDFIRELRRRFDFTISEGVARDAFDGLPPPRIAGPNAKIYFELSDAERARIELIERSPGSAKTWNERQDRIRETLSKHGDFVFDLVVRRKLRQEEAATILGIPLARVQDLLCLHRENELHLATVKLTRAEEIERSRLFARELEAKGAPNGLNEFLRDFRRRFGIYMPATVARQKLLWRKKNKGVAFEGIEDGRNVELKVTLPLTEGERRRLKALAGTKWDSAVDRDALRREVLAADGKFLVRMLELKKLTKQKAAELADMEMRKFESFRIDLKAGLEARHLLPPPEGEERERQIAILREEASRATRGERKEAFIRRVGALGVLLSRDAISAARSRTLHGRS